MTAISSQDTTLYLSFRHVLACEGSRDGEKDFKDYLRLRATAGDAIGGNKEGSLRATVLIIIPQERSHFAQQSHSSTQLESFSNFLRLSRISNLPVIQCCIDAHRPDELELDRSRSDCCDRPARSTSSNSLALSHRFLPVRLLREVNGWPSFPPSLQTDQHATASGSSSEEARGLCIRWA